MKRCSQCDFIYEDDQTLCDMDGQGLVDDITLATSPSHSAARSDIRPGKSRLRTIALPALAGLFLATLLFLAYWTSPLAKPDDPMSGAPKQVAPPSNSSSPTTDRTPTKPDIPPESLGTSSDESPALTAQRTAHKVATKSIEESNPVDNRFPISRRLQPLARVPPLPRLAPAKVEDKKLIRTTTSPKPTNSGQTREGSRLANLGQKTENKVGSFLKKTGRILKKPFKS